jgi:predicted acetyltransferase
MEKGQEKAVDMFVECGRALVAEVHRQAECLATAASGTIRYLGEDLPLSVITAVSTSRGARKQGLAGHLTARLVADEAARGAAVSALGMFEQGYYNRLGYGTGGYENLVTFDPSLLRIPIRARIPRRVTHRDWSAAHKFRLARLRGHGSCNLTPPQITRAEMLYTKNGFGLGYADGPGGRLRHHIWCRPKEVEQGPYMVLWMAYRTRDQFLELMDLIRGLGDQVRLIKMREPQGVQLQDLIREPFKHQDLSERSKFENRMRAAAYWQMRICDLPACLERTHLRGGKARFNLKLTDPIAEFLPQKSSWRGVGGDYVVSLGSSSSAKLGTKSGLPTLKASVGAFTRLWLGVLPATGLAMTDDLAGPQKLLERLDRVLCLPDPKPDWDF